MSLILTPQPTGTNRMLASRDRSATIQFTRGKPAGVSDGSWIQTASSTKTWRPTVFELVG
jgi:hypothetical protein